MVELLSRAARVPFTAIRDLDDNDRARLPEKIADELAAELGREARRKGLVAVDQMKDPIAEFIEYRANMVVGSPAQKPAGKTIDAYIRDAQRRLRSNDAADATRYMLGAKPIDRMTREDLEAAAGGQLLGRSARLTIMDELDALDAPADTPIDLLSDRKRARVEAKEKLKEKQMGVAAAAIDALKGARQGLAAQIAARAKQLDQEPRPDPTALLRQLDQFVLDLIPKIFAGTSGKFALGVVAAEIKRLLDSAEQKEAA